MFRSCPFFIFLLLSPVHGEDTGESLWLLFLFSALEAITQDFYATRRQHLLYENLGLLPTCSISVLFH